MRFEMTPRGPFDLVHNNATFSNGGWLPFGGDPAAIGMAFPVEGWRTSAAVIVRQTAEGHIQGEVVGADPDAVQAWQQALAVISLDVDGTDWPHIAARDPIIGRLQQQYQGIRPILFYSPYEAAAALIIGQRISIQQGRALRQGMAQALGAAVTVGATTLYAFPQPHVVRDLQEFPGLSAEKIHRLHGIAQAALDGLLDRAYLRSLPAPQALAQLQALHGIGPFIAQGVLLRGAGVVDEVAEDAMTLDAVRTAYDLGAPVDLPTLHHISDAWRPYRTWATVLLHVWSRSQGGNLPRSERRQRALTSRA